MICLHYTSHTKAYNTIYTACIIVEQSTPLQTRKMIRTDINSVLSCCR